MLSPLGRALKNRIGYILRDEFITNSASPLTSPRTCEPGPGTLTLADAGNKMSIANSKLTYAGGSSDWINPGGYWSSAITRVAGRAFYAVATLSSGSYNTPLDIKTTALQGAYNTREVYSISLRTTTTIAITPQQASGMTIVCDTAVAGTAYPLLIILRDPGAFFLYKTSVWNLAFVTTLPYVTTPLYLTFVDYSGVGTVDNLSVFDMPAPYNNEASWRTSQLLNPIVGATSTHATSALIDVTYTYNAGLFYVNVRKQDDTHYWQLYISSSGVYLRERNGGGLVNRASYAWAPVAGSTVRTVLMFDGNYYRGYAQVGTGALAACWSYTDINNLFLDQTALYVASLDGGISEINCWPAHPELPV